MPSDACKKCCQACAEETENFPNPERQRKYQECVDRKCREVCNQKGFGIFIRP